MAARLYTERYGATERQLGQVAISERAHAALNPQAIFQQALTEAEYLASKLIVEPVRRLDCAPPTDGAVCLLVASRPEADAVAREPVWILGSQGIQAGREEFIFGRPRLGVQQQTLGEFRPTAWDLARVRRSGVRRDEIQGFYTYDAFSPLVWFALERFGFCGEGEASHFCEQRRIGPGGSLPVNSNGGMLSEGHLCGYNHIAEMVRQLCGKAGARQIRETRFLQWGSCYGDSVVLGR